MTFDCGFPVSRELTAFVPDITRNKAACGAKKQINSCKVEKGRNGFLPTWSGSIPLQVGKKSFLPFSTLQVCLSVFFAPQTALFRVISGTNAVNSRETGNPQWKVTCLL